MTKPFAPVHFPETQGVHAAIAFGIVFLLAVSSWLPHLPDSLWLDETITFWVVKDGLAEALSRAVHYQSQPAYYGFIWLWTQIFGTSEIALRMPSLLAALGACALIARLGTALTHDRETGLLGMIVFASTWNVYRESVDARPYMLGLLVLLCLALCLLTWLEKGRWRDAWLVGALAALLPHLHLFFALTFPAFVIFAALRWSHARARIRQVGLIGVLLLVGAILFLPAAGTLLANGGAYSFVPPPHWSALFSVFVWTPPVVGLLVGIGLSGVIDSRPSDRSDSDPSVSHSVSRDAACLLAIWVLVPLLLLFSVSMFTNLSIFLARFLIPAAPAVCLLYAIALRRVDSAHARIVMVIIVALASYTTYVRPHDDFRGAALTINEFTSGDATMPVLLASGLIEGANEEWLRDPEFAQYLNAPIAYYRVGGRVVALPRELKGQSIAKEIVDPILREAKSFAAIEWFGNGARIMNWLTPRARKAGYRVTRRAFGGVRVALFRPSRKNRRK